MSKCPFHVAPVSDAPASPERRSLLVGLGLAGSGAMISALSHATAARALEAPADCAAPDSKARQPFYGTHQSGVTTERPATALFATFNVLAPSRQELERLFRSLTERIAFLTMGGPAPTADPRFPPPDSGIVGPIIEPDNLTMTLSVGASLFDGRFGLDAVKPAYLSAMPSFPNDALEDEICHGDLLLQICSNTADTNIHALRDIIKHHPDLLMLRWKYDGLLPIARPQGATPRNLLGFKDGTANPDTGNAALMDRIVWVRPESGEPAWAMAGSYQVVRVIRQLVERWDRTPLQEQENIIGRDKASGAPLTLADEKAIPDYAADPDGARVPLNAHIRLANPRLPETEANVILRRSFNYSRGVTKAGQLDIGLIFVCFQSNLEAGFATVQRRLKGEPLEEYIKPVGGGYFFALPGAARPGDYLGRGLIEADMPDAKAGAAAATSQKG